MRKLALAQIRENSPGKVVEILGGALLQKRLLGMGLYPGKEVTKLSHIGLKGPVVARVGRSILALGHGIAMKIMVEAA